MLELLQPACSVLMKYRGVTALLLITKGTRVYYYFVRGNVHVLSLFHAHAPDLTSILRISLLRPGPGLSPFKMNIPPICPSCVCETHSRFLSV